MTVTYTVRNNLYINLTNRCSNDCDFCVRLEHPSVGDADSLWLEREPTKEEVWAELCLRDMERYDEIVFCGFGEPTERLEDLLWLCGNIRTSWPRKRIRINTNGHASLLAGEDVSSRFAGLADCFSISLNYATAEEYNTHCRPKFGPAAHEALLEFARGVQALGIETVLSVVEGTTDINAARECARQAGLPLHVREKID